MTAKRAKEINEKLSSKVDGELRALFYKSNGLPKQGLYTKDQILEKLGITDEFNIFENIGIRNKLGQSLSFIRKEARDSKLQFIDIHYNDKETNRTIAAHGYMSDINKMQETIKIYEAYASQRKKIAKDVKQIMSIGIKAIEAEEKNLIE